MTSRSTDRIEKMAGDRRAHGEAHGDFHDLMELAAVSTDLLDANTGDDRRGNVVQVDLALFGFDQGRCC